MQQINDQIVNPADPDGTLTPDEFNAGIKNELQNVVTQTNQTFDAADQVQLGKGIARYGSGGDFYDVSGTADNIILTPQGSMQSPHEYFAGMRVRFIAASNNTTATTVNVNGLGVVAVTAGGEPLTTGIISEGKVTELFYNSTTGTFEVSTPSRVVLGENTTIITGQGFRSPLQVNGIDGRSASTSFLRASNDAIGFNASLNKSRATSIGSLAAVQNADSLGNIIWSGDTGGDYSNIGGIISCQVNGAPTPLDTTVTADFLFKQDVSGTITTNWIMEQSTRAFIPNTDGVQNVGTASNRLSQVWATTGTIQTSDQTQKSTALPLDDALLDALAPLAVKQWKWLDAIAEKGEGNARVHIGPITQEAQQLCADAGIDISQYGFWCSDMVPAEYDEIEVLEPVPVMEEREVEIDRVFYNDDNRAVLKKEKVKMMCEAVDVSHVEDENGNLLYMDEAGNLTTTETANPVLHEVIKTKQKVVDVRRVPKKDADGNVIMKELQGFRKDQLAFLMIAIMDRRIKALEDIVNV